jgi:hypothetical protein
MLEGTKTPTITLYHNSNSNSSKDFHVRTDKNVKANFLSQL